MGRSLIIASLALACACGPDAGQPAESHSSGGTLGSETMAATGATSSDTGAPTASGMGSSTGLQDGSSSSTAGSDSTTSFGDCVDVHEGDLIVDGTTAVEAFRTIRRIREGDLLIEGFSGENLEFLECLRTVDGSIIVRETPNLTSLAGLEGVSSVGDPPDGTGLFILGNAALMSLAGLDNVKSLGILDVRVNASLAHIELNGLERLSTLRIGYCPLGTPEPDPARHDNPRLEVIDGLQNLEYLGGVVEIVAQSGLVSLQRLHELAAEGKFYAGPSTVIQHNPNLPYAEVELLQTLTPDDGEILSCRNLGEPEEHNCGCNPD